jgi:hypothetical protein
MLKKVELGSIYKQLDRHPLDRAVFINIRDCNNRLSRNDENLRSDPESPPLSLEDEHACNSDSRGHIASKFWPSISKILSGVTRADFSTLFPSPTYLQILQVKLYGATNLSSPGEAPSLRADSFYRYGYLGTFIIYLILGILYGGYNGLCLQLLRHATIYARLNVALLPLTLLTGNLSLGLLTQLWLFMIQLPKNLMVIVTIGFGMSLLVKSRKAVTASFLSD